MSAEKKTSVKAIKPKMLVLVHPNAHVDVADLPCGKVTKSVGVKVSPGEAKKLVSQYGYLTTLGE
jgi:hypothetical protein